MKLDGLLCCCLLVLLSYAVGTNGDATTTASCSMDFSDSVVIVLCGALAFDFICFFFILIWLWRRGWVCPCADREMHNGIQSPERKNRDAAADDYLTPMSHAPGRTDGGSHGGVQSPEYNHRDGASASASDCLEPMNRAPGHRGGGKRDRVQVPGKNDRDSAAADYLEPVDHAPDYQAPAGPYECLNLKEVGQRNIYAEMKDVA